MYDLVTPYKLDIWNPAKIAKVLYWKMVLRR